MERERVAIWEGYVSKIHSFNLESVQCDRLMVKDAKVIVSLLFIFFKEYGFGVFIEKGF